MKKLRLLVDALRVEPFEVMPGAPAETGTVMGRDAAVFTDPPRCPVSGGSCDTGIPICVYCRAG